MKTLFKLLKFCGLYKEPVALPPIKVVVEHKTNNIEAIRSAVVAIEGLREDLYRKILYSGELTTRNMHTNQKNAVDTAFRYDTTLAALKELLK